MRSDRIKTGIQRAPHRALLKATGISDEDMRVTLPRSSGYTFEKNVLVAEGKITFDNPEGITTWTDNCLFSRAGKIEGNKLDRYSKKGSSELRPGGGNVIGDPQVVEFDKGIVKFAPDSPAAGLGVEPIDVSKAGPRR